VTLSVEMAVGWTCQQSAQMNMRLANFMDIRSYKGVHQRLNKEVIATANRSRVSNVVDRLKIFLTCSLISVQILVVVSHTMCAQGGGHKNSGDDVCGPAPLEGAWLTP